MKILKKDLVPSFVYRPGQETRLDDKWTIICKEQSKFFMTYK